MTFKFSPKQMDLILYLARVPGATPEGYAKMKRIAISTVTVQLTRARKKIKEGWMLVGFAGGLISAYVQAKGNDFRHRPH